MKLNNRSNKRSIFTATVLAASLAAAPIMADDYVELTPEEIKQQEDKSTHIGFGSGAVIGGLIAGPLGAIVTSAIGAFAGKHYAVSEHKTNLAAKLVEERSSYQQALANYQQKLMEAEQAYQQELIALQSSQQNTSQMQAENLLMSLQFSTGSSEIKPHYNDQIDALAKMLTLSPELNINLSGYTDLQGNEQLNQKLSLARATAVKNALVERGINEYRIALNAYGENAPVVANNEKQVSFYDRRVVIKLEQNENFQSNQQTVSNY